MTTPDTASTTDASRDSEWRQLRRQMAVSEHLAYFDHAAVAPLSRDTAHRMQEWLDDITRFGTVNWMRWRKLIERARGLAARMIHAAPDECAFVHSTTEGINLVADGLDWQAGDNVVTLDSEFPSNLYPWMLQQSRGVELRRIATRDERWSLDQLRQACDARTRIVTVSWVSYATGFRNPLEDIAQIAHDHGALLFVDAIQGLGVMPLDVERMGVDFLAADGHKWLLGPEGAGLFYVRQEHLERLRPMGVGWNSVRHAGQFTNSTLDLKPSADRYEGGTFNMVGLAGLAASLEWFDRVSVEAISRRLQSVTEELCERLRKAGLTIVSDRTDRHWSGIVAADHAEHGADSLKRQAWPAGVILNSRGGHLRLSPHVYTTKEDFERLEEWLKSLK